LRARVDEGASCPCCTQFAKVYRRKLNAGIAVGLIRVWRTAGDQWCNLRATVAGASNHVASAEWWGLLVESPQRRDDGGRGKAWRLTPDGVAYVRHELAVPKYARVYDGRCLSLDGEPQNIGHALGKRFDYRELMDGI
jgi:hypothetical protein